MNRASRRLFAILFGLPLLLIVPVALIGSTVCTGGVIEFEVLEKGPNGSSVAAKIPGFVVPLAMLFIPCHIQEEIRCEFDSEADWALDVARAAIRSIGHAPDGVYVEVQSKREIIRITKEGDYFKIFVDTPDEMVRASVPIGIASTVLASI